MGRRRSTLGNLVICFPWGLAIILTACLIYRRRSDGGVGSFNAQPSSSGPSAAAPHLDGALLLPDSSTLGMRDFKAKRQQDVFIYDSYFRKRPDLVNRGVFVEFGARDGVQGSNSYFFEKEMGWRGVLVEADYRGYARLIDNRPDAVNVYGAVGESDGGEVQFLISKIPGGSGAAEVFSGEHKRKACPCEIVQVPTHRLNTILERGGILHVNYMTIDTEGGELGILKTIDFNRVYIEVLQVEVDTATGSMKEVHDVMEANRFRQVHVFASDSGAMEFIFENQRKPPALAAQERNSRESYRAALQHFRTTGYGLVAAFRRPKHHQARQGTHLADQHQQRQQQQEQYHHLQQEEEEDLVSVNPDAWKGEDWSIEGSSPRAAPPPLWEGIRGQRQQQSQRQKQQRQSGSIEASVRKASPPLWEGIRGQRQRQHEIAEPLFDDGVIIDQQQKDGPAVVAVSPPEGTALLVELMMRFIKEYKVTSMIDIPSGGPEWTRRLLKELPEGFRYHGGHMSPGVVETNQRTWGHDPQKTFSVWDVSRTRIPPGFDFILCRDALQHLPMDAICDALRIFSESPATWLLVESFPFSQGNRNRNLPPQKPGTVRQSFEIDLRKPPFGLRPDDDWDEAPGTNRRGLDKHLYLFRIDKLKRVDFRALKEKIRAYHEKKVSSSRPEDDPASNDPAIMTLDD